VARYAARRLAIVAVTLVGISMLTFTISHVIPGDPARLAAGPDASEESVQAVRESLHLNDPLPVQYAIYVKGLLQFDLGTSVVTRPSRRTSGTTFQRRSS
jgi:peptide/nickel transport system permease protein